MKHDELAVVVGRELLSAFLDDKDFREAIREVNRLLELQVRKIEDHPIQFGLQSTFNSFMVSSFHATRAIELVFKRARDLFLQKDLESFNFMMQVQHSYCMQAVMNLHSARQLFSHKPVSDALGAMSRDIFDSFEVHFCNLKTARDALAHDDERVFGIVKREQKGSGIEECQYISLRGAELGCKDERLNDVTFRFPSSSYFPLLAQISGILKED